ncbi:HTH-type transcriptional regulator UlaR [Gynuella sunshinyii]|uniref:Transcriptional regulator of sugar metabolism n=1 Tax=Gynuella sunshinyii YC6258 TaxID=1445510 RepID=A0A0C5VSF6_9GAMM|nr:HTH-type transcriptional regulator UlaR [Gynuella sunshinyii]AJQ97622.1 transcriptional regulator of sugar metabolism [Gynuella sunshinyii YC6258]
MNESSRHRKILQYLSEHTSATVTELVDFLDKSPATIRRDITKLDESKKLKKVRNGAERIAIELHQNDHALKSLYPNMSDIHNVIENDRIARKAVELCMEKDNVFISEGAATFLMGRYLLSRNIQVYTNYMPLATYLITEDFPHLIVLGGQYVKNQNLLVSPDRHKNYQGRYLFCSGDGITESGLTKSGLLAFMEEKKLVEHVDKIVALIDSDKIGVIGGVLLFSLDELDIVITGKDADPEIITQLKEKNIAVYLV